MAASVVQSKKGYFSGNSTTVAFDSNVTAGNTILVTWHIYNVTETGSTTTDTLSNSYTRAFWTIGGDSSLVLTAYYAVNISGGACTITINPGGSSCYCSYCAIEISGVQTSPLDGTDTNTATSTAVSAGPITTTTEGIIVAGMTSMAGSVVTISPDGDYTQLQEYEDGNNYMHMNVQYRITTGAITDTANWTMGSSLGNIGGMIAFKAAATVTKSDVPPSAARRNAHILVR